MGFFDKPRGTLEPSPVGSPVEEQLHAVTTRIVKELISLTPESMTKIQFEIVSTEDGGADIGLVENHPDAKFVALSDSVYQESSAYLPLAKKYISGWRRSQITLTESGGKWKVEVDFESA